MSPRSPVRIVLTGFMGSGKTTVGRLLAQQLDWTFVDLDDEVTQRFGLSVPEIFAQLGEPRFREEEALALDACLKRVNVVLALGGGTPEIGRSRDLLAATTDSAVVYLHGEFEALRARCSAQSLEPGAVNRPLLRNDELARERYSRRVPIYVALANLTLETDGHSPRAIAERLAAQFRELDTDHG